jgi:predicted O-methyltransferase YrrM
MFNEYWYSDEQCKSLVSLVNSINHLSGSVLEIGCWEGKSTISIANACFPNELFCIDTWLGNTSESKVSHSQHITEIILSGRDVYSDFIKNMNNNTKKNYSIVKEDCFTWLQTFNDPIKFIHIDANADYNSVSDAIKLILPNMVTGGIICGNNFIYSNIERKDLNGGVEKAVRELLPGFHNSGNLWYWISDYN